MSKRDPHAAPRDAALPAPEAARDVVFVYGHEESGDYGVIRKRDDRVELGRIRPVRDGEPIHSELVRLSPRSEHGQLFDVEVLHDASSAESRERARSEAAVSGPSRVATRAYRDSWDRIFTAPGPGDGTRFEN